MTRIISILLLTIFLNSCGQTTTKKDVGNKPFFEKIIFHTSGCFGPCPTYHLQVDPDKKVKLFAETVYKNDKSFSFEEDSIKTGYFNGIVNDSTFMVLNKELETIGLDTLEFDGASCCDGSIITIIVYYDGKKKYLSSMFPPAKANKLIGILYDICEKSKLTRTEKFDIEKEKDNR